MLGAGHTLVAPGGLGVRGDRLARSRRAWGPWTHGGVQAWGLRASAGPGWWQRAPRAMPASCSVTAVTVPRRRPRPARVRPRLLLAAVGAQCAGLWSQVVFLPRNPRCPPDRLAVLPKDRPSKTRVEAGRGAGDVRGTNVVAARGNAPGPALRLARSRRRCARLPRGRPGQKAVFGFFGLFSRDLVRAEGGLARARLPRVPRDLVQ